ncbi:IS21 family transposase [Parageobacillus thermoglucosidasius]|uniref:IS21 family transposase n=3 Tax=Parageobacillus thermoglucosidasius TaxID=1426 RepID=UPI00021137D5|nr:IS21 family transposase [Parageobacillus thermoglucosidasius]AEH49271.1 Integrase catalytic region [Parageobacillus thermoglucosidasius C56-YS93]
MLAMPEIHYIKHLRENKDLSISEIARKTGLNWRTVKKYADGNIGGQKIMKKKRGMMYELGYGEIIDDWLEEDAKLPRKERRTNRTMFEQLQKEHGFPGSYRTVCAYIQERKPHLKAEKEKRYERLEHPPGEAQVDFGTMQVVKDGALEDKKLLILSFPHSNAGFAHPLPSENRECFLEGLKQLFHQAGGVPRRLRMDNLSAAVVTVGKGDNRQYTEAFLRFQAHYGFEVQPCNPASGHEKGNVERKVYYVRHRCFVPAPVVESDEQLTEWLRVKMIEDRSRLHYEKGVPIEELWKEDQKELKALPLDDLPIFSLDTVKVNKYGEITVDGEKWVIHQARVNQSLVVQKGWDRFICLSNQGEVVFEAPRPYMNQKQEIPWEEIFNDWEKKPRSVSYSRFFKYLPEKVQTYLTFRKEEVKQRVRGVRELLKSHTLKELDEWLNKEQRFDLAPHELKVLLEAKQQAYPEKWEETYTPSVFVDYETDLHLYDQRLCPSWEGGTNRDDSGHQRDL